MLVLLDRNFVSAAFLQALRKRQAHVLARLASNRLVGRGQRLSDGSRLLTLTPKQYPELCAPLSVRIISYRLHPEAVALLEQVTPSHSQHGSGTHNPKVREVHRLVTTRLHPEQYPALDLCLLYHERWEVELVIDALLLAPVLAPAHQRTLLARVVGDLSRPEWLLPPRRLRFNSRVIKRSRNRFQIKRPDHVFFSAKHFLFLSDPPHSSFRDLIVIDVV